MLPSQMRQALLPIVDNLGSSDTFCHRARNWEVHGHYKYNNKLNIPRIYLPADNPYEAK